MVDPVLSFNRGGNKVPKYLRLVELLQVILLASKLLARRIN